MYSFSRRSLDTISGNLHGSPLRWLHEALSLGGLAEARSQGGQGPHIANSDMEGLVWGPVDGQTVAPPDKGVLLSK